MKNWKHFPLEPYLEARYPQNNAHVDEELHWLDKAGQELLKDVPNYIEFLPNIHREIKWIGREELVDCILYFKNKAKLPEYKDVTIHYWMMSISHGVNPEKEPGPEFDLKKLSEKKQKSGQKIGFRF